ncbi:related to Probable feruloyl esterase B-2 [Ramularia collo-cygni]|uniref:Carboxylic ester hydrolase n=1 Tax=Ramularia collo-cygni TaxID=112498 RepID=A0A2D3UNI3_9PEZI|nr:related to Probable feruloyl esterase B-2 [Ramularia collo-cygni]CZT14998.1 related to Probable feruloyl esterase B-2 [Ramularia collo-cygni]
MTPSYKKNSLLLALGSLAAAQQSIQYSNSACSDFASTFTYPNLTIYAGTSIPAGTNITLPYDDSPNSCGQPYQVVDTEICRLTMYVTTSSRSGIHMEAWLPSNWTGRFLATGNGGLNGCVGYADMAYGVSLGFASVGANNGHNGTTGEEFIIPDVLEDFVWRSLYTETVVGKAVTKAFYEEDYTKSYYLGCSTGGRQGFKMAQSYPDLFDGIVAGAPALTFNNLTVFSGSFYPKTGSNTSETYLSPAEWALVQQDVMKQCDGLDGVEDNIIEAPELCTYTPVGLQCPSTATNTSSCLTSAQIKTVSAVLSDLHGENGALIYPRLQPGVEVAASRILLTGQPFSYTADWFRYAILNDTTWDPATLDSATAAYAASVNPFNVETWEGDLSAYRDRGGKLLHYHGQADPLIPSTNSPRYYEHVVTTMGAPPSELDEFYRFFRVGGMGHCRGGNGAWVIGSQGGASPEAQKNVLMRMVDWVEKGSDAAPESVTGVKFVNDDPTKGVDFERKHCKYPLRNRCKDPANYKSADAWECVV